MKRKTLITRLEDALSKKVSRKVRILSKDANYYPSISNDKEGLIFCPDVDERITNYLYNYYVSRDVVLENGEVIKGVDEYYPQLLLFTTDITIKNPLFSKYDLHIRNPIKSINDTIYIKDLDYDIQRKSDLQKIDGIFAYIHTKLVNK